MEDFLNNPLDRLLLNEIYHQKSLIIDLIARSKDERDELVYKNPNLLFLVPEMSKSTRTMSKEKDENKFYQNFDLAVIVASCYRRYLSGYRFTGLRVDVDSTHELTERRDSIVGPNVPIFNRNTPLFSKRVKKAVKMHYIKRQESDLPYMIDKRGVNLLGGIVIEILRAKNAPKFCNDPIRKFIFNSTSLQHSISPEFIFPFKAGEIASYLDLSIGCIIYTSGVKVSQSLKRELEEIGPELGLVVFQGQDSIGFEACQTFFYIHVSPPSNELINYVVWKYPRRRTRLYHVEEVYEELFRVRSEVYHGNENR